ncbi:Thioredoxin-like protein HCF164 chloroplastic [Zea mays]|uniref:Thioredoxin-like protein HCF164 chloroplastic n=1 Tax=Zea mays TaxID=4577 RepID=A0A1D6L639_MAIZE|nr:Thioredoxin-like protein HCF164 chloroplastic [Zea mays]
MLTAQSGNRSSTRSGWKAFPTLPFWIRKEMRKAMLLGDFQSSISLTTWLRSLLVIPVYPMHEWSVSSRALSLGKFTKLLMPGVMASSCLCGGSSGSSLTGKTM